MESSRREQQLIYSGRLDVFPTSSNHAIKYSTMGRGKIVRFPSKEHKAFKKDCKALFKIQGLTLIPRDLILQPFCLAIWFHSHRFFKKDGSLRLKSDVSNRYKAIEDMLFKQIGVCDSRNIMPVMYKCRPDIPKTEYVRVKLWIPSSFEEERILNGETFNTLAT